MFLGQHSVNTTSPITYEPLYRISTNCLLISFVHPPHDRPLTRRCHTRLHDVTQLFPDHRINNKVGRVVREVLRGAGWLRKHHERWIYHVTTETHSMKSIDCKKQPDSFLLSSVLCGHVQCRLCMTISPVSKASDSGMRAIQSR